MDILYLVVIKNSFDENSYDFFLVSVTSVEVSEV